MAEFRDTALLRDLKFNNCFQFRFVCRIFFLNHLAPPSKGVWLRRLLEIFFLAYSSCYYFNLIAFIISIETETSLLALTKSIYYFFNVNLSVFDGHQRPLVFQNRNAEIYVWFLPLLIKTQSDKWGTSVLLHGNLRKKSHFCYTKIEFKKNYNEILNRHQAQPCNSHKKEFRKNLLINSRSWKLLRAWKAEKETTFLLLKKKNSRKEKDTETVIKLNLAIDKRKRIPN